MRPKTLGRRAEQGKIKDSLTAMRDDLQGSAIVLVGESGMGKTHLVGVLHELTMQTLWDDLPCEVGYLVNASKPIEQMTPFFMWQAIFGRLFSNDTLIQLKELSANATSKPKEKDKGEGGGNLTGRRRSVSAEESLAPYLSFSSAPATADTISSPRGLGEIFDSRRKQEAKEPLFRGVSSAQAARAGG